jgi:hypothetical protein
MSLGVLANAMVSLLKSLEERIAWIAGGILAVNFLDGFDCQATGFLSALVATHSVGDKREPSLLLKSLFRLRLPIGEGILVVFALAANIAQAAYFDSGTNLHSASWMGISTSLPLRLG